MKTNNKKYLETYLIVSTYLHLFIQYFFLIMFTDLLCIYHIILCFV